jgi:hypothetical protein
MNSNCAMNFRKQDIGLEVDLRDEFKGDGEKI